MSLITGSHSPILNNFLDPIDLAICKSVNKAKKHDIEQYYTQNALGRIRILTLNRTFPVTPSFIGSTYGRHCLRKPSCINLGRSRIEISMIEEINDYIKAMHPTSSEDKNIKSISYSKPSLDSTMLEFYQTQITDRKKLVIESDREAAKGVLF